MNDLGRSIQKFLRMAMPAIFLGGLVLGVILIVAIRFLWGG